MKTVSAERLAKIFVEIADTLVDEFDLVEFLHMLTIRVADLVDASAVGILLADKSGRLRFMAASDENAKVVEIYQIQSSEGPCLEAYRTARPVANADLRTADPRWPRFAARATAAGFYSVHAFPLRLRNQVIGALNVFGANVGGGFDDGDVQVVQALADVAAIGLLQERIISRGEALAEQLQGALNTRIVIEQAKGAIAHARQVSVDIAFDILRDYARSHKRQLSALAHAVVSDPAMLAELTNL
jgi:GAF domain-containing protein